MDDIIAPLQEIVEAQIDFHGQRLADILCTTLLCIFGAIAFITGYIVQDVHLTLWIGLLGTLVTAIVVVPAWPFYNKHPEPWLVPGMGGQSTAGIVVGDVKVRG